MGLYNVNLKNLTIENMQEWSKHNQNLGFWFIMEFLSLSNVFSDLKHKIENSTKNDLEKIEMKIIKILETVEYKNFWKIFLISLSYELPFNFLISDIKKGLFDKLNNVDNGFKQNFENQVFLYQDLEHENDIIDWIILKFLIWRIRTDNFLNIYFKKKSKNESKKKFIEEILKDDILGHKFNLLYRISNYVVHPYDNKKISEEIKNYTKKINLNFNYFYAKNNKTFYSFFLDDIIKIISEIEEATIRTLSDEFEITKIEIPNLNEMSVDI